MGFGLSLAKRKDLVGKNPPETNPSNDSNLHGQTLILAIQ
jgi:hypothetical protein